MSGDYCYSQKLRLGKKGVITLPTSIKETLNVSPGDYLEMYVEGNAIVIKAKEVALHLNLLEEFEALAK